MSATKDDYKRVERETAGAKEVMERVFKLNMSIQSAVEEGWSVILSVKDDSGLVDISISRDVWPTFDEGAAS